MYHGMNERADWFAVLAHLAFIIASVVAMFYYPGGNIFDLEADGYSFSQNFFSDMGHSESLSGEGNRISAVIFTSSLFVLAFGQVAFYLRSYNYHLGSTAFKNCSLAFGFISVAGIVILACFPNDTHRNLHVFGVYTWSLAFLVYVTLFNMSKCSSVRRRIFVLAASLPLYLLIATQIVQSQLQWYGYMALTQKLMVYCIIAWFLSVIFIRNSKC